MTWHSTQGRKPRDPEQEWMIRFRCGREYARPIRGKDKGWRWTWFDPAMDDRFDITEARKA